MQMFIMLFGNKFNFNMLKYLFFLFGFFLRTRG